MPISNFQDRACGKEIATPVKVNHRNKRPCGEGDISHSPSVQDGGLLTIREVAALLRVSESTIRNAIRNGQLQAFRFGTRGGSIRIAVADIENYTASCTTATRQRTNSINKPNTGLFKALDGRKLLAAWRQQGVLDGPPSDNNVPSSGSRCAP